MQGLQYTDFTEEKLSNGNIIKYKAIQGTYYHVDTSDRIVFLLQQARNNDVRLKIHYGDIKTGRAWGDVVNCYIGRSTGRIKIPLEIYNKRSYGGGALLDDCIVKIEYANKKNGGILYQHPNYSI